LEKLMIKSLAPLNLVPVLFYPTAPTRLSAKDIPGYEPSTNGQDDDIIDSWAWFRKDEATNSYRLLNEGMTRVAESIANAVRGIGAGAADGSGTSSETSSVVAGSGDGAVGTGGSGTETVAAGAPIDGVIGFSQGGCMASMLTAAMELMPGTDVPRTLPSSEDAAAWSWVQAVREANGGVPLKFGVIYSGFWGVPKDLAWLYEPVIATPTLHYIGSLDTVVDEDRSRGLIERCEEPMVAVHPGGHYVPVSKEWAMPLVGFIRKCMEKK
jgi:fermentation-respiration switch protein FrsA (DUF1100 family)